MHSPDKFKMVHIFHAFFCEVSNADHHFKKSHPSTLPDRGCKMPFIPTLLFAICAEPSLGKIVLFCFSAPFAFSSRSQNTFHANSGLTGVVKLHYDKLSRNKHLRSEGDTTNLSASFTIFIFSTVTL